MGTVALEFVPPNVEDGPDKAVEEAAKARDRMQQAGIADRVNTLMIPGLIEEDPDRPVALAKKMDPLEVRKATRDTLPLEVIATQVTAFSTTEQLERRVEDLKEAGIHRVVFVGVPRTMQDGEGPGMAPTDALHHFKGTLDSRGVILIPTRQDEHGRFNFKCNQGANFALCQLLFSETIVEFLKSFTDTDHRPEILLSMGYVPQAEQRVGLIQWLIQDENPTVKQEMEYVAKLAEMDFEQRKKSLVELYKRIIDGVHGLGFPIGLHLEAPYGFSEQAFETFHEMLEVWSPADS